jgi:hypothetical protein
MHHFDAEAGAFPISKKKLGVIYLWIKETPPYE